jgi:phosphoenolpyruvate---glycerone phosphotransferase subunit DhaM
LVGIVLVSHSAELASGLKALVDQLTQGTVAVVAAGGCAGGLGTDATLVADAICRADSGAGVLVLMDLGSATLSAETALELLGNDQLLRVELADAPLVEGAVAAGVEASLGSALADVLAAAEAAASTPKLAR